MIQPSAKLVSISLIISLLLICGVLQGFDNSPLDVQAIPFKCKCNPLREFFKIYKHSDYTISGINDGDVVYNGTVIQVSLMPTNAHHGAILSIDGRGVVTQHWPSEFHDCTSLSRVNSRTPLPYAFELDDAPKYEHFVYFASDEPFNVRDIKELLERTHSSPRIALQLPPGIYCAQDILLEKNNDLYRSFVAVLTKINSIIETMFLWFWKSFPSINYLLRFQTALIY